MAYTREGYLRQRVRCAKTDAGIDIELDAREGRFQSWRHQVTVRVHHWAGGAQAYLDRKHIVDPVVGDGVLSVTLDDLTGKSRLSLKVRSGR
jgi:hypothetical protein